MENKKIPYIYGKCGDKTAWAKVPGSKSITNRALLLAAMAEGKTTLEGAFLGGDFWDLKGALETLGIGVEIFEEQERVVVTGCGGQIRPCEDVVYVGSAGTAARFVTAMLGCIPGTWHLDASKQMRKRPMAPLLDALTQMGSKVICTGEEGHFPFTIIVPEQINRDITIDINSSSQFLSALLIAGAVVDGGMNIHIEGNHGMAYVKMTVDMIRQFGVDIPDMKNSVYSLTGNGKYNPMVYEVEPDVSAACYFYAAAAVLGISAGVKGVRRPGLQGDLEFVTVLENMGCSVSEEKEGVVVHGNGGRLSGISVDMHSFSDQALTLAAIAPYADADVTIKNVGHIRGQECDRIMAIETNLSSLGISCDVNDGDITIHPKKPHGAVINPFGDHRVAMSFAITGLRTEGVEISDPACTKKTFAEFFTVLDGFISNICV